MFATTIYIASSFSEKLLNDMVELVVVVIVAAVMFFVIKVLVDRNIL